MLESIATYGMNFIPNNKRNQSPIYGTVEAFKLEYADTIPTVRYVVRLNDNSEIPRDWEKSCFVLGTAQGLKVYYVAGYSQDKTELYIDPLGNTFWQQPRKTFFLSVED